MTWSPVKCIPSVTKTSLTIHILSFSWSCFGIYNDRFVYYNIPIFKEYGGRAQYLTMITAYFSLIANGIASIVDLLQMLTGLLEDVKPTKSGYKESTSALLKLRDDIMSFWVFTLSVFVVLLYWGIAAIDLEGIHPAEHRKIVPLFGWYNHYLHTLPLFIVLLQIIFINYQYPSYLKAIVYVVLLGTSYLSWITHLASVKGYWAYTFMETLSRQEFALFIVFCHLFFFAVYLIGRHISASVWNEEYRDKVMIQQEQKRM